MSIYKDCDIRGIYGKEFDERTAYEIGRAVGTMCRSLLVAGDVRVSTPVLKRRLVEGLLESGADVTDLGMCPTPAFYYALKLLNGEGGVMVTASHNPPQYNGFKLMLGKTPIGPQAIAEIERRVKEQNFASGGGALTKYDILPEYEASLIDYFPNGKLKVVIDCANGCMSELAPRVFSALGHDVTPLYCSFDGNFPNRDPNPAVYENLGDLCSTVVKNGADMGVAFDGDGDRVVFVDDLGRTVASERSLVLFIHEFFQKSPSSVVYDLKSSSIVKRAALEMGGAAIMERSGHAFIKKRFLANGSALAGEISGHFFFGRLGYDDGLYAALEMAAIVSKGKKLSELVDRIEQTIISPDIRLFYPYDRRDAALERVKALGEGGEVTELDGVRIEFPDGWLLARKSVTEEGITVRMEADDASAMARIRSLLLKALPELETVFGTLSQTLQEGQVPLNSQ